MEGIDPATRQEKKKKRSKKQAQENTATLQTTTTTTTTTTTAESIRLAPQPAAVVPKPAWGKPPTADPVRPQPEPVVRQLEPVVRQPEPIVRQLEPVVRSQPAKVSPHAGSSFQSVQNQSRLQAVLKGAFMDKGTHLVTNMYGLNENSVSAIANKVHRYEMDVTKDGTPFSENKIPANLERALVYAMRRIPAFKGTVMMTDGSKILYSLQQLEPLVDAHIALKGMSDLTLTKKGEGSQTLEDVMNTAEGLRVRVAHPISQRKYNVLLRPASWDPNDTLQKVQMLQVAVKYSFYEQNRDILLRGKSLFNQQDFVSIGNLILFTGVFQSCRFNGYSKPILNVDLSYTVAIDSTINILQWMYSYASHCRFRNFGEASKNKRFMEGLQNYFKGTLVVANYGNMVTYRLEGFEEQLTPSSAKFTDNNGKETSVLAYFEAKYKKKLDNDGYLLVVKLPPPKSADGASKKKPAPSTSRVTYIPAELCKFTAGQRRKADLDARETSEMINHTRKLPAERFAIIDQKVKEIVQNLSTQNLDLGLQIKNIEVNARVLKPKPIVYKGQTVTPSNGGWEVGRLYLAPSTPVPCGVLVDESMSKPVYDQFVNLFMQVCKSVAFPVQPPTALRVLKSDSYEAVLKKNAKAFAFFICVLPPRAPADLYSKIKATSYVELGVVTQCVIDDQYKKRGQDWVKIHDLSVLKNLVAGINAKLDFENCIVAEPELQGVLHPIAPTDVLIMGLDVFHGDTTDPDRKPSIVALTASRSSHFNRYATVLRSQNPKQELVAGGAEDTFSGMITEVMQLRACPLPNHVIFYRDGVGEGMYTAVLEHEVQTLQLRLAELYYEQKLEAPKLTFIVSQKRNHFRTRDGTSRDGNPPPGTLIDDLLVIDEGMPNFYLYSHKALAGTARPTHYHVLCDENGFSRDQIASFTYALTHLHQGCTKSVSIPAPVYYADLACYLAGSCFRSQVAQIASKIKLTPYMI